MSETAHDLADNGLLVLDIADDPAYAARTPRPHDFVVQMAGMQRIADAFITGPDKLLQTLVEVAVDICGAESAGISIENEDKSDPNRFHWAATAGKYAPFLNAMLPSTPSACSICLERSRPQLFRVSQRFFDIMGVDAPVVTDGLLLPWDTGETRGTIWIMAHSKGEHFDTTDCRVMEMLANFAAMAVRYQRQQRVLMQTVTAAAAATMANELAHQINNPLQSLTNIIYLAREDRSGRTGRSVAMELTDPLQRLSMLVKQLLTLRDESLRPK